MFNEGIALKFQRDLVATQQSRLADLGYYSGKIDGRARVATAKALEDFKVNNELRARPYPGPLTMARLWSDQARRCPVAQERPGEPSWLAEARRLLGTREVSGPGSNPTIMTWAKNLDQWYPGDDVPWCGLFVAHCMSVGAPNEPQGFNRLGARAWRDYGTIITENRDDDLPLGGVCVLWRTHPTKSWHGHVFLITQQNDRAVGGIGGNQDDNVTEAWFDRDRILCVVGPDGWTHRSAPRAETGALSLSEA